MLCALFSIALKDDQILCLGCLSICLCMGMLRIVECLFKWTVVISIEFHQLFPLL
jgi:hypothetical protein